MRSRLLKILICLIMIISYIPITAISVESGESVVDGSTAGAPIAVPEEGLAISGGTLYGIDKTWFANVNPDKGKIYLAISIPSGVTEINNDGLKDSYTSDKKLHDAVTYMDGLGSFSVAALSFDDATGLETIGEQALQGNSQLTGILDLSATNVSVIKKSAFSGCSNLTGVVLPKTLKELGSRSSSAGSVFNGCEGLRYIRVAGSSNQNAVFELPEGLTYIGRQTFKNCFASDVDAKVIIPASVETIGSEAFYSKRISQIIIQKEGDGWDPRLTGYDTSAFKTGNDDLLVVFLNRKSYVDYTVGRSFTGAVKRALSYPVTLTFQNAKEGVIKQDKLNYQSIQYEYDEAAGFWAVNQDYLLPQPAGEQVSKPGYNTFWTVDDKKLTDSGKINITSDNPTVEIDYVIQNPTIQPVADGTVQADFHTLSIDLDAAGPHTVGVQVSHPLLKEQQGTEDTYVYFQYCWWDESGEESGVNGPRSRAEPELFSSSAENGILNRVKTENAVIPIDGQEHARTDGHYYMVEIYGYLVENGGTPELFYKSHHNFIDFGSDSDTEATVSRSYTLQVEVTQVERHAVLFQTGEHGTLEGTSNFAVKDGSTMRKSGYPVPSVAADSGYSFTGWLGTDGITRTSNEVLDLTVTGDMTFTAQYAKDSGSGGSTGTARYTIEASAGHGGGISPDGRVRVSRGSDKTFRITPDAGYEIADVLVDGESVGAVSCYTFETVRKAHTIEALFAPEKQLADPDDTGVSGWPNTEDHLAYLNGYGSGLFGPDDHMTRAQAAQMFYNLLLDQEVSAAVRFTDVPADAWYARAVETLASLGMVEGVGGGKFAPERTITRAEFTVMAMHFARLPEGGENPFSDVTSSDWFYDQVVGAVQYGWITGYTDGTFRPEATITRAEVTAITNRLLDWAADEDYVDDHAGELRQFPDVSTSYWAYHDIVEATNAHSYRVYDGEEHWM
nr:S-layer homology domain-containing protein [Flavonifractor plautii]